MSMLASSSEAYLDEFYHGSRYFKSVGESIGFQIDRFNFLLTQVFALVLAIFYRKVFDYEKISYEIRVWACLIPGILLSSFCYGRDVYHLLALATLSYLATILSPSRNVHLVVLVVAIGYLSHLHISRMIFDYGGYVLDITGPAMIATQKVTSLAFSLYDGMGRPDSELTEEQRRHAIRQKPSFIEFMSYVLSFQTLMCGPLVYYVDFVEFLTGQNFTRHNLKGKDRPPPTMSVLEKLFTSTFFALCVTFVQPYFPHQPLGEDSWLWSKNYIMVLLIMTAATSAARFKYFFAWKLGETCCNASGLGFAGFNEGKPDWDLVSNVYIFKLETSLNFKILLDNWNKSTQSWLRRCAYERTKTSRTLITYILSAVWHGFYPGYYLCFLTAALVTTAARYGRRCLRPRFKGENTPWLVGFLYDCVTFVLTRLYLAYSTAPFVLLSLEAGFNLYKRLFFAGHILCLLGIFVLPVVLPPPKPPRPANTTN